MSKIIDGKLLAEKIKDQVAKEIYELKGPRPNLAIILVGEREDSVLYVDLKEKEAKKVGIDTHIYRCPADISEQEIYATIDFLNKDETIDAILVQLPLPKGYDTDGIILAIDPKKDVDRFHPDNLEKLLSSCDNKSVMPPLLSVILEILTSIEYDTKDKNVCVIANSEVFGISVRKVLECIGSKVVVTSIDDKDLINKSSKADVLITAVGKTPFLKNNFIKKEAGVIDIGITKEGDKVYGDVDLEDVKEKAGFITPVPGGVGPMTIAMLFKGTLDLYKIKNNIVLSR
jgi:methylenetetrahydrofolate dehydrogenase (NADP+) / methenyltetrahydrofolate cyclohydrolase